MEEVGRKEGNEEREESTRASGRAGRGEDSKGVRRTKVKREEDSTIKARNKLDVTFECLSEVL